MSVQVVFIILAIIFYVVRGVLKNADKPTAGTPKPQRNTSSTQAKTAKEIYDEFIKEIERQKQAKNTKKEPVPNAHQQAQSTKKDSNKKNLDWQQVEHTHIQSKKQLIDHEDYHGISHRIDPIHQISEITETEGEVFEFDKDTIDWKEAVISKEILDRKYA
ncbi:MAG: hypothetical protein LRY27_00645 [Chitinophagales bacterium]|nr:hypothetical protein [Chitinophagales bacterium]